MATIQGVYLALFGRPADPLGLKFFNDATNSGANLTAIGDLAATAEYQDRFKGLSNSQIITSIYKSLFNREPDLAGLTFFADALANKTLTINNIAIAILDGAKGDDIKIRDLKIAAADAFTKAIDTVAEINGYNGTAAVASARTFIESVKTTAPTATAVDAAVTAAVAASAGGAGTPGTTFVLANGTTDVLGPNAAEAKFKTTANDDTFIATATDALESVDVVDGGGGSDTLKAVISADAKPTLTSVENIEIGFLTNAAIKLDLSGSTGYTKVTVTGSDVAGVVDKLVLGTAVTLGAQKTNTQTDVTVNFDKATGAADAATITMNKFTSGTATTSTVTVDSIETLNLVSTGGSNKAVIAGSTVETVNISGDKIAILDLQGLKTTLKTVDASTATGAISIDLSDTLTENLTVKLGTGADSIDFTGAGKKITIDSGDGADTITIDASKAHAITTGGGADTLKVASSGANGLAATDIATAAKLAAAAVTIADFTAGTDKLAVDAAGTDLKVTLSGTNAALVTAEADLLAATTKAASFLGAGASGNAEVVSFVFGGDTYVFIDNDDGATLTANDALIKLTGVASLPGTDLTVA